MTPPATRTDLDPERVRENLREVREAIAAACAAAGRDPGGVEICAATKYVASEALPALAAGGVRLVGENRVQDLAAKLEAHGDDFTWHFIGHLQSRKVRAVLGRVRLIHSVCTDSVLEQLGRHAPPETEVMVEVNTSGEPSKDGVAPSELGAFLARCPVTVAGLMTMPPAVSDPEDNRRHFCALRELAEAHGLQRLSMGTSQDYAVAVQEGATIVRVGSRLYA